ncbi:MAG TPA: FHA domain-containing protein [Nostocaceae cyanobacterium]|nr:FHA domain-containing protein [Nostocaceae cyanobacterium]
MQNFQTFNNTNNLGFIPELLHLQTNTSFELSVNRNLFYIGKPNENISPDIDVSLLPDSDVASRIHAQIEVTSGVYFLEDLGSSNGTFLNNVKIQPKTPYQLSIGDRISLGQGNKITFVFQYKQQTNPDIQFHTSPTKLQINNNNENQPITVDKTSKLVGVALMAAAVVILAANSSIGIYVRLPGLVLCLGGIFILFQQQIKHVVGWILIALGIGIIVWTTNAYASINFLALIISLGLFSVGYQLSQFGKVFGYDLRSLIDLIKN